jgi:hypothetical protein
VCVHYCSSIVRYAHVHIGACVCVFYDCCKHTHRKRVLRQNVIVDKMQPHRWKAWVRKCEQRQIAYVQSRHVKIRQRWIAASFPLWCWRAVRRSAPSIHELANREVREREMRPRGLLGNSSFVRQSVKSVECWFYSERVDKKKEVFWPLPSLCLSLEKIEKFFRTLKILRKYNNDNITSERKKAQKERREGAHEVNCKEFTFCWFSVKTIEF